MSQAVCEPLIGEETGRCHHLKRARDDLGGAQPCVLVEVDPLLQRVDLHPRTDMAQEHFACLGSERLAPEEFGREHASTWLADPNQLPCCVRAVDEQSDGPAITRSKALSGKSSARMSPCLTATCPASPVRRTLERARLSMMGEMSTAVTFAPNWRAMAIADVATPQPTSRTCWSDRKSARRNNSSDEPRPPGWITRLPRTARNA